MVWQMNNHKNSVSCVLYHYFLFFIEFWHENFGGLIFGPGIFLGFRLFTPIWSSLSLYSFTPPLFGGNSIDNFIVFTFNNFSLSLMICQYHPWHTCQFSWIQHQSPALRYGTQNLQDKIEYWAFLSFNLELTNLVSGAFLHIFHHWQRSFHHYNQKGKLWWSVPHVRLHIQGFNSGPGTGKIDQLWMWLSLAS